jgi:hypothetical protein
MNRYRHRRDLRGTAPTELDWLMMTLSFSFIAWIIVVN